MKIVTRENNTGSGIVNVGGRMAFVQITDANRGNQLGELNDTFRVADSLIDERAITVGNINDISNLLLTVAPLASEEHIQNVTEKLESTFTEGEKLIVLISLEDLEKDLTIQVDGFFLNFLKQE